MIKITTSASTSDLQGIISLQKQNLKSELSIEEIKEQGFVTVSHTLDDLEKMHLHAQNIIAKDGEKIVAYVLGMTEQSKNDIPRLVEMYESFDQIQYKGKSVADYSYIVVARFVLIRITVGRAYLIAVMRLIKNILRRILILRSLK